MGKPPRADSLSMGHRLLELGFLAAAASGGSFRRRLAIGSGARPGFGALHSLTVTLLDVCQQGLIFGPAGFPLRVCPAHVFAVEHDTHLHSKSKGE